jgi:hypothetical protein
MPRTSNDTARFSVSTGEEMNCIISMLAIQDWAKRRPCGIDQGKVSVF